MITASNISISAGSKQLLRDVDVAVHAGVNVVLGANGAGKSTLIKCLTGALTPDKGEVVLDECPLSDYTLVALAQKRAVLPQTQLHWHALTFPFTANEIVLMGRVPYADSRSRTSDDRIVDEVLDAVDAHSFKERIFSTLSGGEQQRVQLARVLAQIWQQDNACLFLDEPTSSLDLRFQHSVLKLVKSLAAQKQWAVMVALHDIRLAKAYGDNVLLMKHGEIVRRGAVSDTLTPDNIGEVFNISPELALL